MKRNNKKGFTLAELLIVVAIIAVLVAIAIPVFNNATTKAKVSADAANIRASYAEAVIAKIDPSFSSSSTTFKAQTTGGSLFSTNNVELPANGPEGGPSMTVGTSYKVVIGDGNSWSLTTG